jgi:hypothetical protein
VKTLDCIVILIYLLCGVLLTACSAPINADSGRPTATHTVLSTVPSSTATHDPLPAPTSTQTTSVSEESKQAQATLRRFFTLLHDGHYAEAAPLYNGSFEALREWNPDVDPHDAVALIEAGCTRQLRCLPIRRIIQEVQVSPAEYEFSIELLNEDGTRFERGPCCGADETAEPTVTQFTYRVTRLNGTYQVNGLGVYVP